jgi:hypothetical protein
VGPLTTISSFTGIYTLPTSNYSEDRIDAFIADVEKKTFIKMMGDDAYYRSFQTLLDGGALPYLSENNGDFDDFFGGIEKYQIDGKYRMYQEGFIGSIKAFAWFEIMRDFHQFSTEQGILNAMSEASEKSQNGKDVLIRMWNRGVDIYNEARIYLEDYMIGVLEFDAEGEIFENYEHTPIEKISWI